MTFAFTKEDKISELPGPIREHIRTFVINRIAQFEVFKEAIAEEDFEDIRLFCHAQLGVAGSYNCYKLEEITIYIQDLARKEVLAPIKEVAPLLEEYLSDLKAQSI